jgi:magnesium chelatase family protein
VPAPDFELDGEAESTSTVRDRVLRARARQKARTGDARLTNGALSARQMKVHARPDTQGRELLVKAMDRLALSARAHQRVLRVARTIADLENAETVGASHVAEALRYRPSAINAVTA